MRFKNDATADELREEIMRRLEVLTEAGILDLTALPAPKGLTSELAEGCFWAVSISATRRDPSVPNSATIDSAMAVVIWHIMT